MFAIKQAWVGRGHAHLSIWALVLMGIALALPILRHASVVAPPQRDIA